MTEVLTTRKYLEDECRQQEVLCLTKLHKFLYSRLCDTAENGHDADQNLRKI